MKDLEKAMLEEELYLADKFNGVDTNFSERLLQHGYSTIKEYFTDKQEYQFSQINFNFIEEPMPNGVSEIFKMISTSEPGVLFVDWEDTYVVCGKQGLEEFNQQYCEENNITFFPLYTNGGTIVGSTGDFSFGVCCPVDVIHEPTYILNKVKDILQRHTDRTVSINNNDIVVDGNKICGSANYIQGNVFMVIMHFSFNDWSELISNICLTTKKSKPVEYINFINRELFKQEVLEWLLKH